MVFSSSATVYGEPERIPFVEDSKLGAKNPYGRTKLFLEEIGRYVYEGDKEWRIILLRYFNPVGAHESDPRLHTCYGRADGHIAALQKLFTTDNIGFAAYNLGTGRGTSVLEMVANFEKASGKEIPIKVCSKRKGDNSIIYASTEKAKKELGWKAKYGIEEMCRVQWKWASNKPHGYHSQP